MNMCGKGRPATHEFCISSTYNECMSIFWKPDLVYECRLGNFGARKRSIDAVLLARGAP